MKILTYLLVITICIAGNTYVSAQTRINYDFETGTQNWDIPHWATQQKDHVGSSLALSSEKTSHGDQALELMCDFPGDKWRAAVIELEEEMDLTGYETISVDVYLPKKARTELIKGRIFITAGTWWFIEMRKPVPIKRGRWTTITARLNVNEQSESLHWKTKKKEEGLMTNIDRVRKIGVRVEYNAGLKQQGTPYKGPVYIDNIIIK